MNGHRVVSRPEWLAARTRLLEKEKQFSQAREQLSRERRDLPWELVDKQYEFTGSAGQQTLADLFGGQSQLVTYHFMFAPDADEGCPHCSFWVDNLDGIDAHLKARDTSLVAVSRAPWTKIEAFRRRMGWSLSWVSSADSDFNYDFGASFTAEQRDSGQAYFNYRHADPGMDDREGISVFYKDGDGAIFHTYSTYARGIDMVNGAYQVLDLVPKGRDEAGHDNPQFWVRHHDRYGV
jgi:predicted dithiol-disulfide oxidoreductase (DUF899 family)